MPTRDAAPAGAPCWIDLLSSDVEASRSFYSQLFGWSAEEPDPEFGGYFMFTRDGVPVAGAMPSQPGMPVPCYWTSYLASDDAAKTVEKATGAGAEIVVGPMTIGDVGVMAVLADPGGAHIGIWQQGQFPGFTVLAEPGSPSWFELYTRDYDSAVGFYRDVFDWDTHVMSDTPEFRYTTLGADAGALAGIMDRAGTLPEAVPAHWSVYFAVADTDASVARALELGGSNPVASHDTPYGRLASIVDTTGTEFNVMGPNQAGDSGSASTSS
jgi:predicted enzyme related to lactoylglutathione lyase